VAFKNAFLLLLAFVLVSVTVDWYVINLPVNKVNSFFDSLPNLVEEGFINNFPSDMAIEMKAGRLRINRPNPFCLVVNSATKDGIVFDSEALKDVIASGGGGRYNELCHPIVFAGKNYISYLSQDGEYVMEQPSSLLNFTLTKDQIEKMVMTYLPQIVTGGRSVYFAFPWFLIPGYLIFLLLKVYWYVFVVRMVLKVYKVRGEFNSKELYPMVMFVAAVWYWVKWVIIQVVMNYVGGQRINTDVMFFNTILITVGSVFFIQNFSLGYGETMISKPEIKMEAGAVSMKTERKLKRVVKEIPLE
jgi:hypothetical protein